MNVHPVTLGVAPNISPTMDRKVVVGLVDWHRAFLIHKGYSKIEKVPNVVFDMGPFFSIQREGLILYFVLAIFTYASVQSQ